MLVFTTQDAYAADDRWLAALVAPLRSSGVAGVYGRHVALDSASPPERYLLGLHVRAGAPDAASPRSYGAELRDDPLLERELRDPARASPRASRSPTTSS